jgi:hypothetical protein
MMLPNCEQAYIPEPKLTKYLLSETHAVGKAKGKYFRSLGYTEANTDQLAKVLLMIAKSERVSQEVATHYGTKYIVEGNVVTPSRTTARIRTVWVVEPHDKQPRFVMAYPV